MRGTEHLHPEMQDKASAFLAECRKRELPVQITDTFRTVAEQEALFAKGRITPGPVVTNARGVDYQSSHMWGVAFDVCRTDLSPKTGKVDAYRDDDNMFAKFGTAGKAVGLFWGGDFKSFVDKPHFEYLKFVPGHSTATLKKQYGTPDRFKTTWGVNSPSSAALSAVKRPALRQGSKGDDVRYLQGRLNELDKAGLVVDGIFGTLTLGAVKQFQSRRKLLMDGIVGLQTWGALAN